MTLPNFVLVDSNIAGTGGHYLEYAEQILEVAAARGFACHLITNAAFRPASAGKQYVAHPVFDFDMWGKNLSVDHDKSNLFSEEDRRYLRHFYSHAGLLWNASKEFEATRHYARLTSLPARLARRLHKVHQLRARTEHALQNSADTRPGAPHSQVEERAERFLRFRETLAAASAGDERWPEGSADLAAMVRAGKAADGYARALARVLQDIGLSSGDHVFIPTLSLSEARAMRDLLSVRSDMRLPRWSLLFRRDVFEGYSSNWQRQEWAAHEARNLFASFLDLPPETRISFFTDTDMLTQQYRQLDSVDFRTTAIPVRGPVDAWDIPRSEAAKLKVLVLRDNANDYGVSYLATMLEALTQFELAELSFMSTTTSQQARRAADPTWVARSRSRLKLFQPDVLTLAGNEVEPTDFVAMGDICVFIEVPSIRVSSFGSLVDGLRDRKVVLSANSDLARRLDEAEHPALFTFIEGDSAEETALSILAALRMAHAAPVLERTEPVSWTIGFLGDARAEKGFHLLPQLAKDIHFLRPAGRGLKIVSQVFHPSPGSDVRMLSAMEYLRQSSGEHVQCIEGALDSETYHGLLGASDVVLNIYSQHNYISRSSGIFVEALAVSKPVVTTAGTWMSAMMGEWAKPYHDLVLADAAVIDIDEVVDVRDWMFVGNVVPSVTAADETMVLRPSYSICQIARRPAGSSHARLEFACESAAPDSPLIVIAAWHDSRGVTFEEQLYELSRMSNGVHSLVVQIPEGARALWVGLSIRGDNRSVAVQFSRVTWLHSEVPVVTQPGGIAIRQDGSETMAVSATRAVVSICEAYEQYRASCDWVRAQWADAQTSEGLFNDLMADATGPNKGVARFVGREW